MKNNYYDVSKPTYVYNFYGLAFKKEINKDYDIRGESNPGFWKKKNSNEKDAYN